MSKIKRFGPKYYKVSSCYQLDLYFFYKDGEQTEQNLSPKIDIGIQDSTPPKSTNHCMQSFLFKTN